MNVLKCLQKITVELSTMDFDGLMAFVGGELEMAA